MDALKFQWIVVGMLLFACLILQLQFFIHPDVIYLMHASLLMLNGGHYVENFFETNPPLILYLYAPAVLIAKWTSLSWIYTLRLYLLALIALSLFLCDRLLAKISHPVKYARMILLFCIAGLLLFAPIHELGQREHLLLIFSLPYLLLAVVRLEQQKFSPSLAIIIGVLAGFGFALKPYFLAPLILVEAYLMLQTKRMFAWFRIEMVSLLAVFFAYLCLLIIFHADYLHIVLPMVLRLYFIAIKASWVQLLINFHVLFCFAVLFCYVLSRSQKITLYHYLNDVLALALIGFLLAYLIPQAAWLYHILPAFCIAIFLVATLCLQYVFHTTRELTLTARIAMTLWCSFLFALAFCNIYSYYPLVMHAHDKPNTQNFIAFFKKYPHATYLCLTQTNDCIEASLYAQANFVGRFPAFWWEPGILMLKKKNLVNEQLIKDESYLIHAVANDLSQRNPCFVLLDMPNKDNNIDINYVSHFSRSSSFRSSWRNYVFFQRLGRYEVYRHKHCAYLAERDDPLKKIS